jgi:hypothetical protein
MPETEAGGKKKSTTAARAHSATRFAPPVCAQFVTRAGYQYPRALDGLFHVPAAGFRAKCRTGACALTLRVLRPPFVFRRPSFPLLHAHLCRDAGALYAVPQLPVDPSATEELLTRQQAQREARSFITNFTREGIHVYRCVRNSLPARRQLESQTSRPHLLASLSVPPFPRPCRETLMNNVREGRYYLEIDLEDLKNHKSELHDVIFDRPNEYIPMVRPRRENS